MSYQGDYAEDSTVYIYFTTHDGDGASVAPSSAFEAADVKIFKNGSDTEKTAVNGLTMTSPFNSIVGLHCLAIDTNDDTNDAGFWVTGSDIAVVLSPSDETVDSQTVVRVIGEFSIENRFVEVDLVKIHGTALTETSGQLAGRFVDFFDQAAVTFSVATALSSFKATGFNVVVPPSLAEFNARTLVASEYGTATNQGTMATALADGTIQVGTVRDGAIGVAAVADIFSTTALTEAYAADAAAGTPAQLLYLILQSVSEFAISGVTKTVKKLDGSTTAATYTLDDTDEPTSITRAT